MLNEIFITKSQTIKLIKVYINKNIIVSETEIKINELKTQIDNITYTLKYNLLTFKIKYLNENLALLDKNSIDKYDTKTRLNRIEQFLNLRMVI